MHSAKRFTRLLLMLWLSCLFVSAQQTSPSTEPVVPRLVNFSGKAIDVQGKVLTGTIGATFAIYKDQNEGSPLWIETQNVHADAKGNYTVQLGATKPDGLPQDVFSSGEARWLGVSINGGPEQGRTILLSVPYALKAADADTLGGKPASAFMAAPALGTKAAPAADQANEIVCSSGTACKSGFVPVFATNGGSAQLNDSLISQSGSTLTINGSDSITGNETVTGTVTAGVLTAPFIESSTTTGIPIYGYTTSGYNGVYGNSSYGTAGVEGTSTSGMAGVYGYNTSGTAGVYGQLGSGNSVYSYGVYGENDNTSGGKGVYGYNPNGFEGFGVQGLATGSDAIGVGGSTGIYGTMAHTFIGASPIGVLGDSSGDGMVATSDPGVAFIAANNNSSYYTAYLFNFGGGPVFDAQSNYGYVFLDAFGNLNVSGAVAANIKDFKIDHPLDPANKYLVHSSVESSEMKNIYDGVAVLDASGAATVELPEWFEALNGDFRYQLTAIGAPGPNLHIASEVANNHFAIAGGQPGAKVSWQVTGVRHDAYAKVHPMQVNEEKSANERGYYIHPEFYGAPQEKGIAALHRAQMKQQTKQTNGKPAK